MTDTVTGVGREWERWRKAVAVHFDFLLSHGFAHDGVEIDSFWATSSTYRSSSAAVRVTRSTEFTRVDVSLIRLVDGKVPTYPIWVTAGPAADTDPQP